MRRWLLSVGLVMVLFVAARVRERLRDDRLAITFFDIGQGDAALVEMPGGGTMLVDAGGGFGDVDSGRRDILRELLRRSIRRLDVALLTHPDQDHAYGFTGLLTELPVGELWTSAGVWRAPRKRLLVELQRIAGLRKVPVRVWGKEGRFEWGGVGVTAVPLDPAAGKGTNDRCLVVRLEYAGCSVLFTGDIERAGEAAMVRAGVGRVTLLKVAHHGSATSSTEEFLRETRPRWAVISSGLGNGYGHPRTEVVARLRRFGAEVFRTDFHGFVRVVIGKGGEVRCENAHGGCGVGRCEEGGGSASLPIAGPG